MLEGKFQEFQQYVNIIKLINCSTFPRSYEEDKYLLIQHLALQGYGVPEPLPADAVKFFGPTLTSLMHHTTPSI